MIQSPNLRTTAERILEQLQLGPEKPFQHGDRLALVLRQLQTIWNARGEADLRGIEEKLSESMGITPASRLVDSLWMTMHNLDQ